MSQYIYDINFSHFEYGISVIGGVDKIRPHHKGMTEREAKEWIRDYLDLAGGREDFVIMRRPVGNWKVVKNFE